VNRGQVSLLHCNSTVLAAPTAYVVANCMILMEIRILRDGLDHILDAVNDQYRVGSDGGVAKVRTTSHIRPSAGAYIIESEALNHSDDKGETIRLSSQVVVIGGGVMGSALAYWLTRLDPSVHVTVVERDPSYEYASSALSAASIRQQFSTPVNIRISQASIAFLRKAADELGCNDEVPDITLREHGYLYLAAADGAAQLRAAHTVQKACGADVVLLDIAELGKRFGWLNTTDLSLGSLGLSGEGWFDGYALLMAFARKARRQGAHYVKEEVSGLDIVGNRVRAVVLSDGSRIDCSHVVNPVGSGRTVRNSSPDYLRSTTRTINRCSRTTMPLKPLYGPRSRIASRPSKQPSSNVHGPATSK
jgi:hypothetical protein